MVPPGSTPLQQLVEDTVCTSVLKLASRSAEHSRHLSRSPCLYFIKGKTASSNGAVSEGRCSQCHLGIWPPLLGVMQQVMRRLMKQNHFLSQEPELQKECINGTSVKAPHSSQELP